MWIQVRTIDGKETRTVEDLSRLTKIESLRLKIQEIFSVSPHQQRLFYRGKQVSATFCVPAVMQQSVSGLLFFLFSVVIVVVVAAALAAFRCCCGENERSSGFGAFSDPCASFLF